MILRRDGFAKLQATSPRSLLADIYVRVERGHWALYGRGGSQKAEAQFMGFTAEDFAAVTLPAAEAAAPAAVADEFTGHTPGPWRIVNDAQGPCMVMHPSRVGVAIASLTDTHTPHGGFHDVSTESEHPCRETSWGGTYKPERNANARLIAAAPSLLARVRALEKENAELLKDKARLDWLESRYPTIGYRTDGGWTEWIVGASGNPRIRAAIDAALAKHATPQA